MRMTRHDYDLLYRIYSESRTSERRASPGQAEKLEAAGCITRANGELRITQYGRSQLQRVRGMGSGGFQPPRGYVLVPTCPTPEMIDAARSLGPNFNSLSYGLMLKAAPKVKT